MARFEQASAFSATSRSRACDKPEPVPVTSLCSDTLTATAFLEIFPI